MRITGVFKFSAALHFAVFKVAFVFVPADPRVLALSFHDIPHKLAFVNAAILKSGRSLPMFFVSSPLPLLFGDNSLLVALPREHLKAEPVSNHFKLLFTLLFRQIFDFSFVNGTATFHYNPVLTSNVGHFAVVHRPIPRVSEALEVFRVYTCHLCQCLVGIFLNISKLININFNTS